MLIVNTISEAKAQLSALIARVQEGEEIVICKAGKPVAALRAFEAGTGGREPGALKGKIRIAEDFEELPPDIAEAFGAIEP